jgi:hypothetical protein
LWGLGSRSFAGENDVISNATDLEQLEGKYGVKAVSWTPTGTHCTFAGKDGPYCKHLSQALTTIGKEEHPKC